MTLAQRILGLLITSLLAGCSSGPLDPARPAAVLDRGPHQGALRAIEGADGFIEVVTEPVRDAPSGSPKFRVAVYFLDPSQTAPLIPAPTGVDLTATWSDSPTPQTIHLVIDPVPGDSAGAAKFVAPAAEHQGEPSGSLAGRWKDQEIAARL